MIESDLGDKQKNSLKQIKETERIVVKRPKNGTKKRREEKETNTSKQKQPV